MPWYDGPSLLHHLEHVHIASDRNLIDVRFPVQYVIRPQTDALPRLPRLRRAGRRRRARAGDEVVVLPSGSRDANRAHRAQPAATVAEAFPPMSVTLQLDDDVDISRGDMICRPNNRPTVGQDIEAMVCWMTDKPLAPRARYALKHTTRWTRARGQRPALPDRRQHLSPRRSRRAARA